tara:strand:- start:2005 stop:2514 length:510 start_codon:yes stop_codon:yes gene_type:complete
MIAALILLLPSLLPFENLKNHQILAQLACSEAGWSKKEAARVLRVVKNRADLRKTSLIKEATRPYQFNYRICTGKKAKWMRNFHYSLALTALLGDIKAKESVLNNKKVTHYATKRRLTAKHTRCKGYTIREVWEWTGLKPVFTSEVGHVFFIRPPNGRLKPGCPIKKDA